MELITMDMKRVTGIGGIYKTHLGLNTNEYGANFEWRQEEVTILDKIESFDFGKFVHIMDLEGNKIELWEPDEH